MTAVAFGAGEGRLGERGIADQRAQEDDCPAESDAGRESANGGEHETPVAALKRAMAIEVFDLLQLLKHAVNSVNQEHAFATHPTH